jgi:hypothetical protein
MHELTLLSHAVRDFTIDAEFSTMLPARTAEERQLLEASILAHGLREPGVVWTEEKILLDGHGRLAVCDAHGIAFPVVEYSFASRAAAADWIVDTALGRRNLGPEQQAHLRGLRYQTAKKAATANLRQNAPSAQIEHSVVPVPPRASARADSTAVRLAKEYGVSPATIRRDAAFATDVDAIAASAGPEARAILLSGTAGVSKAGVREIAARRPRSIAEFKKMLGEVRPVRGAERAARNHVEELNHLALRLSAAMRAYARSGARSGDRERLTELWELRSEIERLLRSMEGGK